jgi:protein TonB
VSFSQEGSQTLRPGNAAARERGPLAVAFVTSVALHAVLALLFSGPVSPLPAAPAPLVARLVPRAEPRPPAAAPRTEPAPPAVIKNTLDVPKPEVLDDPIKPQPRRRITERPEPQTPAPRRPPAARPPPPPPPVEPSAEPPPAVPPAASGEPTPQRPLDLSIPSESRGRRAERLSPQELNETLTRLSEAMLYPSEALRRGLEGEVVILVELGEGGRILGAEIASGSGHAVLDDAAVRAVLRLGTLGASTAHRTILLPVRFRIL